ncbi:dihydrolipoamide acetyltransferase family protein [Aneurinibacillus terranovensis]|uniref:dihydrolipoamide acetyltransferase family protein n=1 Tax=Aneurinibacillus terranovensis TaxID=278991 RepID=UPI00040E31C4|nr:dihydrolipoamide acetyltransferase family protein [Aneurinibacillus terranovensis]
MATDVFMPKLSMTMETGTILQWFKEEGDDVQEGDILLEVLTDKINIEVESYATGKLLKIYYGPDAVVPVNQVIGYIGAEGEVVPDVPPSMDGSIDGGQRPAETENVESSSQEEAGNVRETEKVRATPAARKIAKEKKISLQEIEGSGPHGRIHKADVENYTLVKATPLAKKIAKAEGVSLESITGSGPQGKVRKEDVLNQTYRQPTQQLPAEGGDRVKVEGMRKVIAQRMLQSVTTAPHVTLTTEVDMTGSIGMRKALLPVVEKKTGFRLSYTEIIMKAVSHALVLHPSVNASLQGDYIVYHPHVHIGLAVSVPNGLVVPVVKQTEQKGLADLTADCKQLAKAARENKLLPGDMSGGTFTISNLGMYAIDAFTPIINQPETAILGVGRILEKPVAVQGNIEIRPMMTLSLSFDHRVVDGAPAAEFLQEVKDALENPYQLIV